MCPRTHVRSVRRCPRTCVRSVRECPRTYVRYVRYVRPGLSFGLARLRMVDVDEPCGVLAFLQRIRTVSEHPNRNHSVGTLKLYVTLPDPWWEDPTRNALCSSYPLPAPVRTPSQTRAPITDSPAIVTNILVRVSVSRFGSFSLIPSRCSQHSLAPLALSLSRPTHLTGRRELWW